MGMRVTGNRMEYSNASLRDCIRTAYGLKDYQIVAPEWMSSTRFDIEAKMPDGATQDQAHGMLRSLLEDRFKIAIHRDSKEHDVYGLVVGKNGPKLTPSDPNDNPPPDAKGVPEAARKAMQDAMGKMGNEGTSTMTMRTFSRTGQGGLSGGTAQIKSKGVTLAQFADSVARYVDRPVVDMTSIEGKYDFVLEVSQEQMMRNAQALTGMNLSAIAAAATGGAGPASQPGNGEASDPGSNSVFESVQKYGLKLEKRKAPVETLVIDHAEKTPTEN
jgi:uncharacterized protein (TIGR03435 family)